VAYLPARPPQTQHDHSKNVWVTNYQNNIHSAFPDWQTSGVTREVYERQRWNLNWTCAITLQDWAHLATDWGYLAHDVRSSEKVRCRLSHALGNVVVETDEGCQIDGEEGAVVGCSRTGTYRQCSFYTWDPGQSSEWTLT